MKYRTNVMKHTSEQTGLYNRKLKKYENHQGKRKRYEKNNEKLMCNDFLSTPNRLEQRTHRKDLQRNIYDKFFRFKICVTCIGHNFGT